jgi:DNA-directed RNA polymerase alpha subunit
MDKRIVAACKIEGCREDDLLYSRVREDGTVCLVIEPGRKVIVELPAAIESEPPPEMTVINEPKPTFAKVIGVRVRLILEDEGLLDAAKLRQMSDEELEAIEGIGSKSVQQIREALDESR